MDKTLSVLLWDLSKNIIAKVKEYQAKDALIQTRTLYVKPKVEDFKHEADSSSYQISWDFVEREEWDLAAKHDFIQEATKQIPEYLDCVAEISKKYKVPSRQAEYWLSRFLQILANKAVDPLSDELIVDQVTTFIRDLDETPTDWKLRVWLDGIWPEEQQYELASEMILRRPNPADFEIETPFSMLPMHELSTSPEIPSAMLSLGFVPNRLMKFKEKSSLFLMSFGFSD